MSIKLQLPKLTDLKPRITVIGVGGAGGNALNNMISSGLSGVEFVAANTDAQALAMSAAEHRIQLGVTLTEGLGAGSKPEIGRAAAEEAADDIRQQLSGSHMCFIAAGMGGGTGTGAASVIAAIAQELGILTVGVVTKPFHFEGARRMRMAEMGIAELRKHVDTLIVIPNQNLFRIATERTTFAEAFLLADQVLHSGVACVVDLIVREGLINLDFADVRTVMANMGNAMMGTGEASGEGRAIEAAEAAIHNPLIDDVSLKGAKGLLLSVTGGRDLTLYEVDEAATRVRQEVDPEANIIVGATFDDDLKGKVRVSIVASGINRPGEGAERPAPAPDGNVRQRIYEALQSTDPRPASPIVDRGATLASAASSAIGGDSPLELAEDIAPEARPEVWRGPGDVNIVEDMPQLAHAPASVRGPDPGQPGHPGPTSHMGHMGTAIGANSGAVSFQPAPPAEIGAGRRRIPDVSEFPAVGQREYLAKVGPSAAAAQTPADPARPAARRPRFFERWTRRGGESPGRNTQGDSQSDLQEISPDAARTDYAPAHPEAAPRGPIGARGGNANAPDAADGRFSQNQNTTQYDIENTKLKRTP